MTTRQTSLFEHETPDEQITIIDVGDDGGIDTDSLGLTDAEADAIHAVAIQGLGPRQLARETGRSPGTVSNLLRRARRKLDEADVDEDDLAERQRDPHLRGADGGYAGP